MEGRGGVGARARALGEGAPRGRRSPSLAGVERHGRHLPPLSAGEQETTSLARYRFASAVTTVENAPGGVNKFQSRSSLHNREGTAARLYESIDFGLTSTRCFQRNMARQQQWQPACPSRRKKAGLEIAYTPGRSQRGITVIARIHAPFAFSQFRLLARLVTWISAFGRRWLSLSVFCGVEAAL